MDVTDVLALHETAHFVPARDRPRHQLISAVVDHLVCDLTMLTCPEGCAGRPREVIPDRFVICATKCLLEVLPGAGTREECLRDVEAKAVVIGVEKPGGHVGGR